MFNAPPVIEGDELIPVSATEFVSLAWGYRLDVEPGTQGRLTGFTITYGNTVMSATRDLPVSLIPQLTSLAPSIRA